MMENFEYLNLSGKQLKLFLAVLDTGSVNKAAELFDLNQSTISYGLDKLREAFGDPLFVKSGRGIVPTDRARIIAPQIREILIELEGLTSTTGYQPKADASTISIAVNVMAMMPYCRALHKRITHDAPQAPVRFLELGSRDNILQMLESQSADLIISVRPTVLPKGLDSKSLLRFDQVCYFDAERRGPVKTLRNYGEAEHAVLDFGGASKSTIDSSLEAMSMTRNIKLRAPNIAALAGLIKGTKLITTMQFDLSRHIMSELDYCPPPIVVPQVNFDLIWHRRSQRNERMVWLRRLVEETVTQFNYQA